MTKSVRVLYVVPTDRTPDSEHIAAISNAIVDLQKWYADQLGGKTFALYRKEPETFQLFDKAASYGVGTWTKVEWGFGCDDFIHNRDNHIWVVYADVLHICNAPERLGGGIPGLCMLPRQDLEGLCGRMVTDDCGQPQVYPVSRWIGGLGHELGHAFGLDHPPGCGTSDESHCDFDALMYLGVYSYPKTYLTEANKTALRSHPSFTEEISTFIEEIPVYEGYSEIDFRKPEFQNTHLNFEFWVENGQLVCKVLEKRTDGIWSEVDFTKDEGSEWLWHFVARNGKLKPRSYDKLK